MHLKIINIFFLLVLLFFLGCKKTEQNKAANKEDKPKSKLTEAEIFHETQEIYIPFHSDLRAGQVMEITVKQNSKLIALLVDTGDKVKKGDLVASLMKIKGNYEYTPIEIYTQFDGVVSQIQHHVGSIIPAGDRLMLIKDLSYMVANVILKPEQMSLVKKHSKVVMQIQDKEITSSIDRIERKKNEIQIIVGNKERYLKEQKDIEGKILCGPIQGSYLLKKYVQGDSMQVQLAEGIKFYISFPAFTEDKALIYPPIPDQDHLLLIE